MKKKLLSGVFALALLVATGYGVNQSMKSDADLSNLALANVEALANNENDFQCSLTKDECKIKVTVNLIPILKDKFNIDVSVGVTVDLTDFTKVYAAAEPNKPKVRCGIDVFCNDLL